MPRVKTFRPRSEKKIPGPNDYPGKHYVWNFRNELHLTELLKTTMTMEQIAAAMNRDCPQPVRLTKNSIVGKLFRLENTRGMASKREEESVDAE